MARGQQNDTKMAESSTPKRKGSSFGRMIIGDVVADPSSDDVSDEKSDEKNHNKSVEVKEETGVDEKSTKYPVKPTKNMASTGNSQAPKDNKKSDKQQPIQQSSYQKKKLRKDAKKKV